MNTAGTQLLLVLSADNQEPWEGALLSELSAGDLTLVSGPAPEFFDAEQDVVVVSGDANWTLHVPAAQTHVLYDGSLPRLRSGPLEFNDRHEAFKNSARYVLAWAAVEKGALVHTSPAEGFDLGGLGRPSIHFPASKTARDDRSPLKFYDGDALNRLTTARWPAELFSFAKEAFVDGDAAIDLTGRSRILVHGPYIYLPKGVWRADIEFSVRPGLRSVPIRVEWGKEGDFDAAEFTVSVAGHYRVELEKEWLGPASAQVIVTLVEPLFDGDFEFHGCEIAAVGAPAECVG